MKDYKKLSDLLEKFAKELTKVGLSSVEYKMLLDDIHDACVIMDDVKIDNIYSLMVGCLNDVEYIEQATQSRISNLLCKIKQMI